MRSAAGTRAYDCRSPPLPRCNAIVIAILAIARDCAILCSDERDARKSHAQVWPDYHTRHVRPAVSRPSTLTACPALAHVSRRATEDAILTPQGPDQRRQSAQ